MPASGDAVTANLPTMSIFWRSGEGSHSNGWSYQNEADRNTRQGRDLVSKTCDVYQIQEAGRTFWWRFVMNYGMFCLKMTAEAFKVLCLHLLGPEWWVIGLLGVPLLYLARWQWLMLGGTRGLGREVVYNIFHNLCTIPSRRDGQGWYSNPLPP